MGPTIAMWRFGEKPWISDGMARKSERVSVLKGRAELIGNREGSLSYELTPWQMRADGYLWIDTPSS